MAVAARAASVYSPPVSDTMHLRIAILIGGVLRTGASMFNDEKPTGPLMLPGDHGLVARRNLRIKTLQ